MNTMLASKKHKRAYYVFIALLYYFLLRDFLEQRISVFGYTDELLAALALPIFLLRVFKARGSLLHKNKDSYWPWIWIMVLSGLLGNVIFHYQPFIKAALPDLFLCIKFWLWIEAGRYLYRRLDIDRYATKIYRHLKAITWFYVAMTLMDNMLHIFPANMRGGFRSTTLFYFHPTSFAACMILLMSILLLIRPRIEKKKFYLYAIILSVLAFTGWRSKNIGSVMLFLVIILFFLF